MMPRPRTMTTDSGVVVGLYEYGDPAGEPVVVFHGVPACGAGFAFADQAARSCGVRLVAPDRPGVGLSAPAAAPAVGCYPALVAGLARGLGIERFAVWGYSGGGPYALACAAGLAGQVSRVAIVSGMGQVGVWAGAGDFARTDRRMLVMARKSPWLARALMAASARLARLSPPLAARSFARELSQSDRAVLAQMGSPAEAMALFTSAFLHGARGVIDDYRAVARPWGIDLGAIQAPLRIFHGDADPMVPLRHAQDLARRIPAADLVVWPGEGHLATVTHVGEILGWLTRAPV